MQWLSLAQQQEGDVEAQLTRVQWSFIKSAIVVTCVSGHTATWKQADETSDAFSRYSDAQL